MRRPFLLAVGANVVVGACGLATGALLARLLGPAGRGELAAVTLWPELLVLLAGLGAPHTIAFFVSRQPDKSATVYANALALGAAQSLAVVAAGAAVIPLALGARYRDAIGLAFLYLGFVPLSLVNAIHAGLLQGGMQMARHGVLRLTPMAVYLAGLVLLAAFPGAAGVRAVVLILVASLAAAVAAGMLMARGALRGPAVLDRTVQAELVRFGLHTQAAQSAQALNMRLGSLVLSLMVGAAVLGQYAVAAGITGFFVTFGQALGVVVLPDVAARAPAERAPRVAALLRWSVIVLVPLAAALAAAAPWLVPALFGSRFAPAIPLTRVLAAAALFLSLNAVLSDGFRGMKRPGVPAAAELACLAAGGLGLWMAIPRYGLMGAAAAALVANALAFALMALRLARCEGVGGSALLPRTDDLRRLRALLPLPFRGAPWAPP